MKVEQLYTGCLSQGAYYIECNGEVAIIDPLREVDTYINKAKDAGVKIKYILETHFHADFVSGHVTLSERSGAPIIYGPNADPSFEATIAKDGDSFDLGKCTISVIHTPGHTMESTTYLLKDEEGKDHAIFTGDTLFLGDVGRPDLAQKSNEITQEDLAGLLYDSLRNKIMPLADDVIVYPAHGAGSACGKNMMKITMDTLGNQKEVNYALRSDMTKGEFISEVTEGLLAPPAYFPMNVKLNKEGYADIADLKVKGNNPLDSLAFYNLAQDHDTLILDVRHQDAFCKGHIPGAIFIGLNGSFAPWVGELIKDVNQKLLLVVDEDKLDEAITRLARVGFDKVVGYLSGGMDTWIGDNREVDQLASKEANLVSLQGDILDVRKQSEYEGGHIAGAQHIPLSNISERLNEVDAGKSYDIHCAGGYRSVIAASILKARGIHNITNILGGMGAIRKTDLPISTD